MTNPLSPLDQFCYFRLFVWSPRQKTSPPPTRISRATQLMGLSPRGKEFMSSWSGQCLFRLRTHLKVTSLQKWKWLLKFPRFGRTQFDQLAIVTLRFDPYFSEWRDTRNTETHLREEGDHTRALQLQSSRSVGQTEQKRCQTGAAAQRLLSPLFTPPNVDQFPEVPPTPPS